MFKNDRLNELLYGATGLRPAMVAAPPPDLEEEYDPNDLLDETNDDIHDGDLTEEEIVPERELTTAELAELALGLEATRQALTEHLNAVYELLRERGPLLETAAYGTVEVQLKHPQYRQTWGEIDKQALQSAMAEAGLTHILNAALSETKLNITDARVKKMLLTSADPEVRAAMPTIEQILIDIDTARRERFEATAEDQLLVQVRVDDAMKAEAFQNLTEELSANMGAEFDLYLAQFEWDQEKLAEAADATRRLELNPEPEEGISIFDKLL